MKRPRSASPRADCAVRIILDRIGDKWSFLIANRRHLAAHANHDIAESSCAMGSRPFDNAARSNRADQHPYQMIAVKAADLILATI